MNIREWMYDQLSTIQFLDITERTDDAEFPNAFYKWYSYNTGDGRSIYCIFFRTAPKRLEYINAFFDKLHQTKRKSIKAFFDYHYKNCPNKVLFLAYLEYEIRVAIGRCRNKCSKDYYYILLVAVLIKKTDFYMPLSVRELEKIASVIQKIESLFRLLELKSRQRLIRIRRGWT